MNRTILMSVLILITMSAAYAASTDAPNIRISQVSQTPDPVDAGDYVELRFRVDNFGAPASDYEYEIDYGYPFSLDPGSPRRVSLGTIDSYTGASDGGAVLYWKLRVDENAVPGGNTVKIRYYPVSGADSTFVTREFPVRIGAEEGLLVVSDATIDPADAVPGRRVAVSLDLENLGSAAVRNVRVTSDVEDTSFAPYGSANGRLIRLIGAGQTSTVEFDFFVSPNAALGVEKLPFTITYADSVGDAYSLEAVVGVPIDEAPSYILNLESSQVYTAGSMGDVVFSISNTGSSPLNFVVLTLEDSEHYEVIGPRQTYLGNLQSDDFETGQFSVYVADDTQIPLEAELSISYRTAYGEQISETRTVQVPIYTQQRAQELGLVSNGNGSGAIVFVLIVIAAIVGFVWWRRRKNR